MPLSKAITEFWSRSTILFKGSLGVKANLKDHPLFLQNCTDQLYAFQRKFAGPSTFQLHDGPPYANGSLHVGHALNKITKDILCRYQVLQGTKVQYTPGWDCHGLPIELKALQANTNLNTAHQTPANAVAIRNAARQLALAAIEEQKKTFQGWAIMADWKNIWTTMDKEFEIKQLEVFKTMVAKGLIYRRNKPVHWSPSTHTALAEAELQYREDHTSQAAYITFPIIDVPNPSARRRGLDWASVKALVWTTTPWTIPANQAIAINPDITYTIFHVPGHGDLLVAKSLVKYMGPKKRAFTSIFGYDTKVRQHEFEGSELVGATFRSPLQPEDTAHRLIVAADLVARDTGTGLVHSAPGHGMEDYKLGQAHGLATFAPVDDQGCFTKDALPQNPHALQGKPVLKEGNEAVLSLLKEAGALVNVSSYTHKYPYDWRSKLPVIQRATPQWFADLTSIQEAAVSAIDQVRFIPHGSRDRLLSFVQDRAEWCISRQRAWGVPIPALYHRETGEATLTVDSVAHIIETIKSRGIDAWWTDSVDDPAWIPASLLGPNGENHFRRGLDTMDVWFDSGTTWTQIQNENQNSGQPVADVYLEGSDQHRGWFQSSLLTFVAESLQDSQAYPPSAPFKTLITHGFTLDNKGNKMSKSEGNVITPDQIMDPGKWIASDFKHPYPDLGPDTLRLWVAMSDFQKDVAVSEEAIMNNYRMMRMLRGIFKLLIALQKDSNPPIPLVYNQLSLIDRIALIQLKKMDQVVRSHYEAYAFHKAMAAINSYIRTDFSKFYFESVKDRMYLDGPESLSRLHGLAVLWEIFQRLIHRLAPMLPLLTEEASHCMTLDTGRDCAPLPWKPAVLEAHMARWDDEELEQHMDVLFATKSAVYQMQEKVGRKEHKMGSSLQTYVHIEFGDNASPSSQQLFQKYTAEELEAFLVVSKVHLDSTPPAPDIVAWQTSTPIQVTTVKDDKVYAFTVHVCAASEQKCVRCWRYVVSDAEAAELEDPVCRRCLGSFHRNKFGHNHPEWLDANIPRTHVAMKALRETGEREIERGWKVWHWDVAYGKE